MKRRLPMISQGEVALAASRLPPVTAQANRHRPSQRTCRQYPDQNTTGNEHDGHSGRGTWTARPIDAYASTVSRHGHTMDMANHRLRSLLATGRQPRRGGIFALSDRYTTIL